MVLALSPWYIRISVSIWLQAGGPLCIPVTVMSATHQADINKWNSPLQLYHLCPVCVNGVRFPLLQERLVLVRGRKDFLLFYPVLPLFKYTLVLTHALFSCLLSCSSSHSAYPRGRGFTHVLSWGQELQCSAICYIAFNKNPHPELWYGLKSFILQRIIANQNMLKHAHVYHLFSQFTPSVLIDMGPISNQTEILHGSNAVFYILLFTVFLNAYFFPSTHLYNFPVHQSDV